MDPQTVVATLHARGARVVHCEGGPRLFGSLAAAGLVDEVLLTVAPLLAGELLDGLTRQAVRDVPGMEVVDDAVRQLIDDMFETMYEAPGIGLAATQVNVHKRVVVMDLSEDRSEPRVFINPEFEPLTDQMDQYQEGCLSVPGFYENVDRPQKVRIKALDRDGKPYELIAEGLLAVCIQHECDHLNGKLFVDYLSSLKRDRIKKKLEKIHRQQA